MNISCSCLAPRCGSPLAQRQAAAAGFRRCLGIAPRGAGLKVGAYPVKGIQMITPLYAAAIALIYIWLSIRVIACRRQHGVSLGDAENPHLRRRIRGHANCAEYAPIGLLLLLMLELQAAPGLLVHAIGLLLLAGRALHGWAFAFDRQWIFGRKNGMVLTFAAIVLGALANVIYAI